MNSGMIEMKSNEIPLSCTHNNEKSENWFLEKKYFQDSHKSKYFCACLCMSGCLNVCVASVPAVRYVTHPENYPNFQRDSHFYLLLKCCTSQR